jgi:hypothetical protein
MPAFFGAVALARSYFKVKAPSPSRESISLVNSKEHQQSDERDSSNRRGQN